MGDNVHQLTSLPYANFEDEYSEEIQPKLPSLHVENVTSHAKDTRPHHGHSHGKGPISLTNTFLAMSKEKKITMILAISLVLLSTVSIIFAAVEKSRRPMKDHLKQCSSVEKYQRVDAGLGIVRSEEQCLGWGGCWDHTAVGSPNCFYPYSDRRGYRVVDSKIELWGMQLELERKSTLPKIFPSENDKLRCIISYETDSRLRVKIFDPKDTHRYEVPMSEKHSRTGHRMQYILRTTSALFGFSVSRTHEASSTVFNTSMEGLIYSDQLLQLNMQLSSSNVYGLSGDHKEGLLRKMEYAYQSVWTTAQNDQYGAHPFLLHVEQDGHASGFFLQNSNAMDMILNPYPAITFRTTGGILDFYIFLGPSPSDVLVQFANQAGRPFLPPLWALGYHFGSENYQSTADLDLATLQNSSFPLDAVWGGRSMLHSEGLELDDKRFPGLGDQVRDLQTTGRHFLLETRPAIVMNGSLYDAGKDLDIFVKDSRDNDLVSKVSPGVRAVFPDYFHPSTLPWLTSALSTLHSALPLDGLYLDQNEPSTQSDGSLEGCTDTDLDHPVYTLQHVPKLARHTLCASARHYGGLRHYDVHNIYGWKSGEVARGALAAAAPGSRTLVLSRSTYLGSGTSVGHFFKSNSGSWEDMKHSIVGMLNYNMYGIPLVGANICGYTRAQEGSDTEEEMCVRWHQLAAFYPLARRFTSQDPKLAGYSDEAVARMQTAMELRYRLLPTLYTLFFSAHTKGEPVVRPVFFNYLTDLETLSLDTQFLVGPSIMVAPVLSPGVSKNSVYFPDDLWYDYSKPNNIISEHGYRDEEVTMDTHTYYVRGGCIVVTHRNIASTTQQINKIGDYVLDVYLSGTGNAFGELFTDDGISLDTIQQDMFLFVKFNATQDWIRSEVTLRYPGHENSNRIQEINIRGLPKEPTTIRVKESSDPWTQFTFKEGVLQITSLNLPIKEAFLLSYA